MTTESTSEEHKGSASPPAMRRFRRPKDREPAILMVMAFLWVLAMLWFVTR